MTERHADDTFSYSVPISANGVYVLILKFTELHFKESNKRVFNIKFGNLVVAEKIDIVAKVGPFAAYDEYIEFLYQDGKIFFGGKECEGAFDQESGKLNVKFEKIGIDNPKVDGLVLFQGPLSETDFYEIPAMRESWEKRLEMEKKRKEEESLRREAAKMKKREKTKIRNDEVEEYEEDIEDIKEFSSNTSSGLVFGPGGIAFIAMAVALYMYIRSSKKEKDSEIARMQILEGENEGEKKLAEEKKKKKKN